MSVELMSAQMGKVNNMSLLKTLALTENFGGVGRGGVRQCSLGLVLAALL